MPLCPECNSKMLKLNIRPNGKYKTIPKFEVCENCEKVYEIKLEEVKK